MTILRSKRANFRPNLFFSSLFTPYLHRIRTVLAPYILHSEVPLDGESTELIRSKYISGIDVYKRQASFGANWSLLRPFVNMYLMCDGNRFTDRTDYTTMQYMEMCIRDRLYTG